MVRFATEDVLARMEVLRRHAPPSLFDAWLRHEGLAYHLSLIHI